ncbi:MAG: putative DNA binding domain-containing protein [Bosea sp.]|uniref:ATP-binding protein n=1 Tax=Bosea sp. (in: a-proteobacteria) TaxID=1871050 RepID=UPI001AD3B22B|nr:ATP-binding protein [Bosea sp. (in: a-proteobacteria)]MBN9454563.1 putative DNA binding domain-containing protein [Bosea sp. (in: a-proteobacteria)]
MTLAEGTMSEPLNLVEQVRIAVSLAEGQFREFKSALEGPPQSKIKRKVRDICVDISEALVGFANADGGEIIIGVEDDGSITGVNDFSEEEISRLKKSPVSHVHPDTPLQSVLARDIIIDGLKVIYFRISKSTKYVHLTSDGRCLRRNDLETIPVSAERLQFDRQEVFSREYDREFIDGASVADLDSDLLRLVADQVSKGISIDRCLQYLGLAEYDAGTGLRLRRAALLLFARNPDRWHPRSQVRILKVNGISIGAGSSYNVTADETINNNLIKLLDEAWDRIRPHLVETRFNEEAKFKTTYMYPEIACRESLVNAIAHRDYSDEGRGIEIYIYNDRIETKNPGGLLSSISVKDLEELRGVHQSRNSYVARCLREIGFMRELGEGMMRIFEIMKSNELSPPEIISDRNSFVLALHHRTMYNRDEILWIDQYSSLNLSLKEKALILMGRSGDLISPNGIISHLGIVDIENYRQIIHSLQQKGILESAITKHKAQKIASKSKVGVRDVKRFRVKPVSEIETKRNPRKTQDKIALSDLLPQSGELYVANIPLNTTDRDIIFAFRDIGQPDAVKIPLNGSVTKGFAFVEYEDRRLAEKALGEVITLGGRRLSVRWRKVQMPKQKAVE